MGGGIPIHVSGLMLWGSGAYLAGSVLCGGGHTYTCIWVDVVGEWGIPSWVGVDVWGKSLVNEGAKPDGKVGRDDSDGLS